ncbi:hypothetical protein NDU88_005533 [Pleurodeles waltl]|uniref:Uncharacterized protein n=1 Tax=Pleurodeles waltl TaxID=8319 RepID=A0AAV7MA90_PLEWA|nr:hypothetical protein NDU88_005533 [Pleurodeles waltl]
MLLYHTFTDTTQSHRVLPVIAPRRLPDSALCDPGAHTHPQLHPVKRAHPTGGKYLCGTAAELYRAQAGHLGSRDLQPAQTSGGGRAALHTGQTGLEAKVKLKVAVWRRQGLPLGPGMRKETPGARVGSPASRAPFLDFWFQISGDADLHICSALYMAEDLQGAGMQTRLCSCAQPAARAHVHSDCDPIILKCLH